MHVYIAAGTYLAYEEEGIFNRCVVFDAQGNPAGQQDKIASIGFDRTLGVVPSDQLEPIETPFGKLGVVIGSDTYYFEAFKILREKGAQMIAVPSFSSSALQDLLRCRANEHKQYMLYSCYADEQGGVHAGIFAPLDVTVCHNGVTAYAQDEKPRVVSARINLQKLSDSLVDSEPNLSFLQDDYLKSYRYCGTLPIVEAPSEQPEEAPDLQNEAE